MAEASSTTPASGEEMELPSGPAAAALLAMGIGTLVLGIFTTWAEASTGVHDFLDWIERVGPLSGKVGLSVIAFVVSWAVLGVLWKEKNQDLRQVTIASVVLMAVGFLFTFPVFFQAFA